MNAAVRAGNISRFKEVFETYADRFQQKKLGHLLFDYDRIHVVQKLQLDSSEDAEYIVAKKVLFTMCAGNELWFSMVYLLHFGEGPAVLSFGGYSVGLWRVILYAVTPIMVLKQIISLIHLYTAALDMAAIDEAERANKPKPN
ncbi:unnamed protein product [Adineta steineri]|uniref:Uncharacterized protein n=1 Tax=Adineta steineri TaxID=433720 RepID=A0A814HKL6_9BILA|nr:unnamed protein product [Adineta steineri]